MEAEPPLEQEPPSRFGNHVDETLYEFTVQGWGNLDEHSGEIEAPTGWFAIISIEPDELAEIVEAFEEEIERIALDAPSSLIGHWLVREDAEGSVSAEEFDTYGDARSAYDELNEAYGRWSDAREPEQRMSAQEARIRQLCEAYGQEYNPDDFHSRFDLPEGYLAGWIGGVYFGISAEGEASS